MIFIYMNVVTFVLNISNVYSKDDFWACYADNSNRMTAGSFPGDVHYSS